MIVKPSPRQLPEQCSRTYQPLLEAALSVTTGPVLELGLGDASTPWLNRLCKNRKVVSIESSNPDWHKKFLYLASERHLIQFVPYEDVYQVRAAEGEAPWSVVFIDHASVSWRLRDMAWFYHVADIVIAHDTEAGYWGALDWSLFKHVTSDRRRAEHATAISKHIPVNEWTYAELPADPAYDQGRVKAYYTDLWIAEGKDHDWAFIDPDSMIDGRDILNLGCFYPVDELKFGERARGWQAIDFTPAVVDRCRALKEWPSTVEFKVMDMRSLWYPENTFDTVFDFSSGDHLPWSDWDEVVAEVHRVLRPGGTFVVMYANQNHHQGDAEEQAYGYTRWSTPEQMRASLERAGFTVGKELTNCARSGMVAKK